MKIAIVSGGFSELSYHSLPWKYAYEISRNLIHRGHEVYILTDYPKSFSINCNKYRIPVISTHSFLPFISGVKTLNKTLDLIDPEIVYYFSSPVGDFKIKHLKLRVPIILHIGHSIQGISTYLHSNPTLTGLSELFKGKLIADCYTFAKIFRYLTLNKLELKLMATTKTVAESLIKICFDKLRVKILPLVVDREFLKSCGKRKYKDCEGHGLNDDDFIVCYFGGCNPKKGVLELVSAVPAVAKKIPRFKLLLLLRPPFLGNYLHCVKQRIIETRCQDHVIIMDRLVERDDLISILARSDIVVLPFKYLDEEPPLTLLEAMTLGKAVITTRISCIKYIVEENRGITLTYPSPTLIAHSICDLYQNESKKHRIERNSMDFAHKCFVSWDELARIIEKEVLID